MELEASTVVEQPEIGFADRLSESLEHAACLHLSAVPCCNFTAKVGADAAEKSRSRCQSQLLVFHFSEPGLGVKQREATGLGGLGAWAGRQSVN